MVLVLINDQSCVNYENLVCCFTKKESVKTKQKLACKSKKHDVIYDVLLKLFLSHGYINLTYKNRK